MLPNAPFDFQAAVRAAAAAASASNSNGVFGDSNPQFNVVQPMQPTYQPPIASTYVSMQADTPTHSIPPPVASAPLKQEELVIDEFGSYSDSETNVNAGSAMAVAGQQVEATVNGQTPAFASDASSSRRASKRVDLKAKAKAALPNTRFDCDFQSPMTVEQVMELIRSEKAKKEPVKEPVKQEQAPVSSVEPDAVAVKQEASPMDVSQDVSASPAADSASFPTPSPMPSEPSIQSEMAASTSASVLAAGLDDIEMGDEDTSSDEDDDDFYPDLALPTKLYILKYRLPQKVRTMLSRRRYRANQKKLAAEGGWAAKSATGKKKEPSSKKKKRPNCWTDSDEDMDNMSTASDHMLDAIYNEDAANAPVEKRKKSAPKLPTADGQPQSQSQSQPPTPQSQRTPEEQRVWDLANFGAYSDVDEEVNMSTGQQGNRADDKAEETSSSDEDPTDPGAAPVSPGQNAKQAKKDDETARIKVHASMELAERRAYDRAVQNEINDSYAFCDSNPKTMVLSRDSLLIKLDLSEILNNSVMGFFSEQQLASLKQMLPECDRNTETGFADTFMAPIFLQSLYEYQELLMTGSLDPDMREMRNVVSARRRREMQDSWKGRNFERYWGEQYSTRYSKSSEDRGSKTKGPPNVYWKPPAMKADLHERQAMEGLLIRCINGDIFAIRRRKAALIKEKKWPLPSLEKLKSMKEAGMKASSTPLPSASSAAAAQAEAAKKAKWRKKKAPGEGGGEGGEEGKEGEEGPEPPPGDATSAAPSSSTDPADLKKKRKYKPRKPREFNEDGTEKEPKKKRKKPAEHGAEGANGVEDGSDDEADGDAPSSKRARQPDDVQRLLGLKSQPVPPLLDQQQVHQHHQMQQAHHHPQQMMQPPSLQAQSIAAQPAAAAAIPAMPSYHAAYGPWSHYGPPIIPGTPQWHQLMNQQMQYQFMMQQQNMYAMPPPQAQPRNPYYSAPPMPAKVAPAAVAAAASIPPEVMAQFAAVEASLQNPSAQQAMAAMKAQLAVVGGQTGPP